MIQAVYVSSSNIDAVGYKHGELFVRFKHGGCYVYKKVPHATYVNMIEAESVGQFFHKNIRGKFDYLQLEKDPFTGAVMKSAA